MYSYTPDEIKTKALRFNEGKAELGYVLQFSSAMESLARIFEFGAVKYEEDNWLKGGKPDKEYIDSAIRHLVSWTKGEVYDSDSGCSHLGHAVWNLCALMQTNHPTETFDPTIFSDRKHYWLKEKECTEPF